jgi:hypothetical protein
MQTKPLSMTLVRSDVDSFAVIGYSNAKNKTEFVRDFARDNYGADSPIAIAMVKVAFREALELN